MAKRRNKDKAWFELILAMSALLVLASIGSPGVRDFFSVLWLFLLGMIGLIILAVAGFCIFKIIKLTQTRRISSSSFYVQKYSTPAPSQIPPSKLQPQSPVNETITKADLVQKLRSIDWFQFEKLVALAYESQGYRVDRRGGANPDGGIDLTITKDQKQTAIQCKQWKTWNVGVKAIREFLGALTDSKIQHGIFITLNGYTGEARQLAEKHGIEIINEAGLIAMLKDLNTSDPRILAVLNDKRKFCPKCENEMVLRVAGKGASQGQQFWGCTGFPRCRFTMGLD